MSAFYVENWFKTRLFTDTTSGGSRDWAKGHHDVSFSFTYEMRDTGKYGFILPADQILPNAKEVLHSVIAMIKEGIALNYFPIVLK